MALLNWSISGLPRSYVSGHLEVTGDLHKKVPQASATSSWASWTIFDQGRTAGSAGQAQFWWPVQPPAGGGCEAEVLAALQKPDAKAISHHSELPWVQPAFYEVGSWASMGLPPARWYQTPQFPLEPAPSPITNLVSRKLGAFQYRHALPGRGLRLSAW